MKQAHEGEVKPRMSTATRLAALLLLLPPIWIAFRLVSMNGQRTQLSTLPYSSRILFDSMLPEFSEGRPYSEVLQATQFRGNLQSFTRLKDGRTARVMTYSIRPDGSEIRGTDFTWVYALFRDDKFAGFLQPGTGSGHLRALWQSEPAPNDSISSVLAFQRASVSSLLPSILLTAEQALFAEQSSRERLSRSSGGVDWGLSIAFIVIRGLFGSETKLEQTVESRRKWQVLDLPLGVSLETLTERLGQPTGRWVVEDRSVVEFDPRESAWSTESLSVGKFLAVIGESGLEELYSKGYHRLVQFRHP